MTWDINFQSADELVQTFKKHNNQAYDLFQKHPEYEEVLIKRAEEAGYNYFEVMNVGNAEEVIIFQLWEDILSLFTEEEVSELKKRVAIGLVNSGEHRARVERTKYDVILINYGMITFINQCTKYKIASNELEYIEFCDRKEPKTVTLDDINTFYNELIGNYRTHGVPFGPLILLAKEADFLRGDMLYVKELFIVSHELAHILLDHREQSHEVEYHADHLAYRITKDVLTKKRIWLNEKFMLLALKDLFQDMQHLRGAVESPTHPQPYGRLLQLTTSYYGEKLANALKKALLYGDNGEYEKLLSEIPDYPQNVLQQGSD
ncbi:hypothetical protein [Paenibacillus sp. FSL E2-0201]|uniref:hypothetical protein n=1 Tax=Paenibacillus sp. FSL E2-0201 TaxID=2954726 RepID=UPI0030DD7B10